METINKHMTISSIKFNNFSNTVKLEGTVLQDNLCFDSTVKTDISMINILMNHLQRINPDNLIMDRLQSEELPDDEIHYTIDLEGLNNSIALAVLFADDQYKQIRA
jgi:hypothetical protein